MITYNDIYEFSRKEKVQSELQKLPEGFLLDVADYLKEKKVMVSRDEDSLSDSSTKTKKQLENARTLFKELIVIRRKKILNLILIAAEVGMSRRDFDNMMDFEKQLFNELMTCIENSNKKISSVLENGNNGKEMLVFKDDVAEFMGFNGERLGEFKKGQTATLPKEIAKILIEDGKAELIKLN
ncbi:DNA replication complex GINS family protein [Candidatus Pacearchaeota archaeon]|nr:DNA replication complex GINS family protein [Candidatus Pacearchaeota archaeon]